MNKPHKLVGFVFYVLRRNDLFGCNQMHTQHEAHLKAHSAADESAVLALVDSIVASHDVPTLVRAVSLCLCRNTSTTMQVHNSNEPPPPSQLFF